MQYTVFGGGRNGGGRCGGERSGGGRSGGRTSGGRRDGVGGPSGGGGRSGGRGGGRAGGRDHDNGGGQRHGDYNGRDAEAALNRSFTFSDGGGLDIMSEVDIEALYRTCINKANFHTAPGPDGLRYSHLQIISRAGASVWKELNSLRRVTMQLANPDMPDLFWQLFTSARLDALANGDKIRPIACSSVVRRLTGSTYVHTHANTLAERYEDAGQYAVGSQSGTEKVALTTQLRHDSGLWVYKTDFTNAYNELKRTTIIEGLPKVDPTAVPYTRACTPARRPTCCTRCPTAPP